MKIRIPKGKYFPGKPGVNFVNWRGIDVIRSNSKQVYMSSPMRLHKKLMGLSTRLGGSFRRQLLPVLPEPKSMAMQTAFRLSLLQWLKDQVAGQPNESLGHFNFNEQAVACSLYETVEWRTGEDHGIMLSIPGFVPTVIMAAPASVTALQFTVMVASCSLKDATAMGSHTIQYDVPYNDIPVAARDIPVAVELPAGAMMLVLFSVKCLEVPEDLKYWSSRVVGLLIN